MFVLMLQTAAVGMPNLLPQQPPIILENVRLATPDWSKPGVEILVAFAASDDVEVVSAEVVTERDDETWSTPLHDDGESGDDEAGDGLWSGSIGPFDFGSDVVYFARAIDNEGLVGEGPDQLLEIVPVHDVGRMQLALTRESNFGGFFLPRDPPQDAGQWPGNSGQNYLAGGGLWIGSRFGLTGTVSDSVDRVMHYFYGPSLSVGDWQTIEGEFPISADSISDQDLEIVYTDSAAPSPLGLYVTQTSRQWSGADIDDFIIFEYEVTNLADRVLDEVFVSFWVDPDVVLENNAFINDDLVSWDEGRNLVYSWDAGNACNDPVLNPDNILCPPGYFGLSLLTHPVGGKSGKRPYTVAVWPPESDPERSIEDTDTELLELMTGGIRSDVFDSTSTVPDDYRMLMTARPISLDPGIPARLAFGIVIGESLEALQENADAMIEVFEGTPLAADDIEIAEFPSDIQIFPNFPNPFVEATTIQFQLEAPRRVRVAVFDLLGQEVAVIASGQFLAGIHRVTWQATGVPGGVYFYRIESNGRSVTRKMVVVR